MTTHTKVFIRDTQGGIQLERNLYTDYVTDVFLKAKTIIQFEKGIRNVRFHNSDDWNSRHDMDMNGLLLVDRRAKKIILLDTALWYNNPGVLEKAKHYKKNGWYVALASEEFDEHPWTWKSEFPKEHTFMSPESYRG